MGSAAGQVADWRGRRARRRAALIVAVAFGAALGVAGMPGATRAVSLEVYALSGYEIWYSPTVGTFAGTGRGGDDALSAWHTSIEHSLVISPSGLVTGGWARLYRVDGVRIDALFSSGTVHQTNDGPGCTAETHVVRGSLYGVARSDRPGLPGAGLFDATLVHHRTWLFGRCISYAASVEATITVIV